MRPPTTVRSASSVVSSSAGIASGSAANTARSPSSPGATLPCAVSANVARAAKRVGASTACVDGEGFGRRRHGQALPVRRRTIAATPCQGVVANGAVPALSELPGGSSPSASSVRNGNGRFAPGVTVAGPRRRSGA